MAQPTAVQTTQAADRTFPVSIQAIDAATLSFDLYIKPDRRREPILYRAVGVDFTLEDRQRLLEQGIQFLYVPFSQHAAFRKTLLDGMGKVFDDPQKSREQRVKTIRTACSKMIEDVLLFPDQVEAVEAVGEIGRQFAEWSSKHASEFSYLLDMTAHDYYTVTHMVNVGVGCGLLAREVHPNNTNLLAAIVQGGLLHDIGKRHIPEKILNKEGRLDPDEWEQIKSHPQLGYDELRQNPAIPLVVLEMTRDHHEHLDGKGYPAGKKADELGFAARVCAIIDVFDSICSARPYRGPTPPADTLDIMRKGLGSQFDPDLFKIWEGLVGRLVTEDPGRALPPVGAGAHVDLSLFAQEPTAAPLQKLEIPEGFQSVGFDQRRRHERFQCNVTIYVRFIRLGKAVPVAPGQWTPARMADLSRGGIQLRTPWPLSLADLLEVELPLGGERKKRHLARVVRVREVRPMEWLAGLCFVDAANPARPAS